MDDPNRNGITLFWIPLGAGGTGFVRMNGRIYEAAQARRQRRAALDLYHTALVARTLDGEFVVETMWPRPDAERVTRGVVAEGPVFADWMAHSRIFRYEVRCWKDGLIPDSAYAIGGPQHLSEDHRLADRLVELTRSVPGLTWGRDQAGVGEMWNSNSVVSWLLTRTGLDMYSIRPPAGGRAPGWDAGVAIAGSAAVPPENPG